MSFAAMYAGRCNAGEHPIRPGEQITEDTDGGFSHVRCLLIDDEPETVRAKACTRCHLIHAGECF